PTSAEAAPETETPPEPDAKTAEAVSAPLEAAPSPEPEAIVEPEPPPPPLKPMKAGFLAERPQVTIDVPRRRLAAQSRRDFLLFGAGVVATATLTWWLLPDRTKAHLLGMSGRDRLDTLAARVGLSPKSRERALDRALTFDDDVSEALYSK